MAKKIRSARGVEVDFDLLKIKQQLTESPSVDVSARENFVEKRLRRRTKRATAPTVAKLNPLDVEELEELEEVVAEEDPVVDPTPRVTRKVKNA